MNVYEIVTEKIVKLLEQGIVPWRRPWTSTGLPAQPREQEAISRRKCVFAFRVKVRFAILVDDAPG